MKRFLSILFAIHCLLFTVSPAQLIFEQGDTTKISIRHQWFTFGKFRVNRDGTLSGTTPISTITALQDSLTAKLNRGEVAGILSPYRLKSDTSLGNMAASVTQAQKKADSLLAAAKENVLTFNAPLTRSVNAISADTGASKLATKTNLLSLSASNLTSGTLPDARFSGTYSSQLRLSNTANDAFGDTAKFSYFIPSGTSGQAPWWTRTGGTVSLATAADTAQAGHIKATTKMLVSGTTAYTTKTSFQIQNNTNNSGIQFNSDRELSIWAGGNIYANYPVLYMRGPAYVQIAEQTDLLFGTGNTETNVIVSATVYPGKIRFRRNTGSAAGAVGGIYFADHPAAGTSKDKSFAIYPDADTSGVLNFAASASYTDAPSVAMVLTKGGNIGLGTTSPATKLDVVGSTTTDFLKVGKRQNTALVSFAVTDWLGTSTRTSIDSTGLGYLSHLRVGLANTSTYSQIDSMKVDADTLKIYINGISYKAVKGSGFGLFEKLLLLGVFLTLLIRGWNNFSREMRRKEHELWQ